jgi:peptidyl-prolyl cis-trans isomerase B (cyclophilin B)
MRVRIHRPIEHPGGRRRAFAAYRAPALLILPALLVVASGCTGSSDGGATADSASGQAAESAKENTAVIEAIDAFIAEQSIDKSDARWKTHLPKPPEQSFEDDATYYWVLNTNMGEMKVRLMPDVAPMHVASTIYLTRLGFYDGLAFHRVITGFMAQGGDPLGNGTGGPGYKYEGEFDSSVKHDGPGKLSMANAGPGTDGSQFFLTFVATPHLDGRHTIFGEVTEGNDTLEELEKRGSRSGGTTEPLSIETATIEVE